MSKLGKAFGNVLTGKYDAELKNVHSTDCKKIKP